LPPVRKL